MAGKCCGTLKERNRDYLKNLSVTLLLAPHVLEFRPHTQRDFGGIHTRLHWLGRQRNIWYSISYYGKTYLTRHCIFREKKHCAMHFGISMEIRSYQENEIWENYKDSFTCGHFISGKREPNPEKWSCVNLLVENLSMKASKTLYIFYSMLKSLPHIIVTQSLLDYPGYWVAKKFAFIFQILGPLESSYMEWGTSPVTTLWP